MEENYETIRRLMLAINKIDGTYYLFARKNELNENTLAFFYAMDDDKPHSQKEISDEWLVPRTTIHSIVKKMLAEGYILFPEGQHTKEKRMMLTEKGREYAEGCLKNIYTAEERAMLDTLENFSPEFVEALAYFGDRLCGELEHMEGE